MAEHGDPPPRGGGGKPVKPRKGAPLLLFLFLLLVLLGLLGFIANVLMGAKDAPLQAVQPDPAATYLRSESGHSANHFSPAEIPPWLMVHVAAIGLFQVLSLLFAARVASKEYLTKRDAKTVLFLCEVPMYLGLFGTLLGVCLTQFISGSLVAPLAYFTTMGGVLLHVLGKLTIWLRLPEDLLDEE